MYVANPNFEIVLQFVDFALKVVLLPETNNYITIHSDGI